MIKIIFLCFVLSVAISCNSSQIATEIDSPQRTDIVKIQPKTTPTPIRVSPNLKLEKKQSYELDRAIPSKIRAILENANVFEILAEVERKDGKVIYPTREISEVKPNVKAEISDGELRKEILESFYHDVAKASPPANCWEPHHILRAESGGETAEMEICFSCSKFEGKSSIGDFSGTTGRGDEKTENLFNQIIEKYGVEIKKD